MSFRVRLIVLAVALALSGIFAWQKIESPKFVLVSQVIDGDTIRLEDGRRIRYINVDTPEIEEEECFASQASKINQELVEGKLVRLELDVNEMDRFGRFLAYVYLEDETFVNQYLLESGAGKYHLDTVNLKYTFVLVETAQKAHGDKKGLWAKCAPDKKGCQVKGNYDDHGHRWYHLPHFRHYEATRVNLENGDQWFCTEEEAIKAGFKKARE